MNVNQSEADTQMVRKLIKENIGALLLKNSKTVTPDRFFVTQINDRCVLETRLNSIDSFTLI